MATGWGADRPGWPLQGYFAAVGVVVMLAGAAAGGYVYVQSGNDARDAATKDASFTAGKAASQIATGVGLIRDTSAALTANRAAMQSLFTSPANCVLGYAPLGAFDSGRIDIVRTDGTVICSSKPGVTGKVFRAASWLKSADAVVVAPSADPLDGHQVATFTFPVAGLGLLAWFIDLDPLGPKLGSVFASGVHQLEFLIVSADGRSIVSRSIDSSKWTGRPVDGTPFASAADAVDRSDVGGTRRWYGVATVAGAGWKVYAGVDAAAATAAAARLQQTNLGITLGGVLLTLLALAFVYRSVARPMTRLAAAVRASRGSASLVPVAGPSQLAALGNNINDLISSLQQSERTYARLFEGSPLPVLVVDLATGEVVHVNEAAVNAFGYSREDFESLDALKLSAPRDPEERRQIEEASATPAPTVRLGPLTLRKKDGSSMRAMVTSYDLDDGGRWTRVQIVEDVTNKERIEQQMRQAQRLESLGQLAGGVAHDFNNLLTVMLNVTQSLKPLVIDREAARDVARLEKAAQSASRLTHQLLAFARREVVPQSVVNVNEEIADLRDLLARTIGSHVVLTLDLAAETWPILMDRGHLEQVVINLAVNARDAMTSGGKLVISTANVTVDPADAEAHPGRQPGRYVQLQVSDSGAGMDQATLAHAFEPFFTTKPVGLGTGMGLATVYGIVKQVNGHVSIYSEVGHGTTVTLLIPVTTHVVAAQAPVAPAEPRPASGTVLVVEDYSDLRELFEEILSGAGYQVLAAGDGHEALDVARAHKGTIDILLTDVVMPNMLGPDLARELRAVRPNMRVLFMSGHAQPVFTGASPLPEGSTLLQKPFMEAELLQKVGDVLAAPVGDKIPV
jgi:PAS domain S-box-containing protein